MIDTLSALEQMSTDCFDEYSLPFTPVRVCRDMSLETPEQVVSHSRNTFHSKQTIIFIPLSVLGLLGVF